MNALASIFGPFIVSILIVSTASAQLDPSVKPTRRELRTPVSIDLAQRESPRRIRDATRNGLRNIVLIGYWPPSNEMLREFSPHREQNPGGWIGANWEGRGYNVYAFFPEFPDELGIGQGDFRVDYQATSHDFWKIVPLFDPIAALSFGRALPNKNWEIELITRNLSQWVPDFLEPRFPTPSPPDARSDKDRGRRSRIPSAAIVEALKAQAPFLTPFADDTGAGSYLCEFLGYHLSWYRALHPHRVLFAAHTHVGSESELTDLKAGLKVALRAMIEKLPLASSTPPADAEPVDVQARELF